MYLDMYNRDLCSQLRAIGEQKGKQYETNKTVWIVNLANRQGDLEDMNYDRPGGMIIML